jgi:uncharacterized protein (TIGR02145 family)
MLKTVKLFGVLLIVSQLLACKKEISGDDVNNNETEIPTEVIDIDGNLYSVKKIGNQIWMGENLRTTRFCTGEFIPQIILNQDWGNLASSAWSYYNNNSQMNSNYGKIYNGYALVDSRNICPCGWEVPTIDDWIELLEYLRNNGGTWDGSAGAYGYSSGNKLAKALASKSNLWYNSVPTLEFGPGSIGYDLNLNNSSGFNALPGGSRSGTGSFYDSEDFEQHRSFTLFGSSTPGEFWDGNETLKHLVLTYDGKDILLNQPNYRVGTYVRCIKKG